MLLIGGALLDARTHLTEATAAFVTEVQRYAYDVRAETTDYFASAPYIRE